MPQLSEQTYQGTVALPGPFVFKPMGIVNGVALFEAEGPDGVSIAAKRLSISTRRTSGNRHKTTVRFALPKVAVSNVGGVDVYDLRNTDHLDVTMTTGENSTVDERNLLRDIGSQLFASSNSDMLKVFGKNELFY